MTPCHPYFDQREQTVSQEMSEADGSTQISIDSEEFTRLQTQLIDLRTANYQLKEDNAKAEREIQNLQELHQNALKDLEKANRSIQRSKKAKEYQLLVEENEGLLTRLHTQEEDFKLQNKTLLDEIANVSEENVNMKKRLKTFESAGDGENGAGGHSPELMRLKAENLALQKSLQAHQEQLQLSASGSSATEGNGSDDVPISASEEVSSLRLSLATLEEEKRLLQEQLSSMADREKGYEAELGEMKKEVQKQSEKSRKKQESVVQLQEEKERLIADHKKAFDQMVSEKDQMMEGLKFQVKSFEEQSGKMSEATKATAELINQLSVLRTEKEELELKFKAHSEMISVVSQERDDAKDLLDKLSLELENTQYQIQEEKKRSKQLQAVAEEAKKASDDLADQLLSVKEDKLIAEEEQKTATKLAESRKSLLDKMAIKEQEIASEQKKRESELISEYQSQIDELSYKLDTERSSNRELKISLSEVEGLKEKVAKYEIIKATHEERLQKIKEEADKEKNEILNRLEQLQSAHSQEVSSLKTELEGSQAKSKEAAERVQSLEEELGEKMSEVKIVEKKSSALIKDLKRQLQQLQKREDKLQHQLMETRGNNATPSQEELQKHSRESSLSSIRGVLDMSNSSPNTSLYQHSSTDETTSEDTQTLLDRIAQLQQEKWQLEEKVQHLENTGSALAEDLLQKSQIIQRYYMENKADHALSSPHLSASSQSKMSPMRLVQWAKTPSKDETMAEVNRKMQRALEEALMKNIHLQQNIDMLSSELQKQEDSENTPTK